MKHGNVTTPEPEHVYIENHIVIAIVVLFFVSAIVDDDNYYDDEEENGVGDATTMIMLPLAARLSCFALPVLLFLFYGFDFSSSLA